MKAYLSSFFVLLSCLVQAQVAQITPIVSGGVSGITRYENNLFIYGAFTAIGTDSTFTGLAMLDAHTGAVQNWNPAPNGEVNAAIVQNGKLIVAGTFSTIAGQSRNAIAIFDASTGVLLSTTVSIASSAVDALWADGNDIYFGAGYIQRFDLTTGVVSGWTTDQVLFPGLFSICRFGNYIYAGGEFQCVNINNGNNVNLVRFNLATGQLDTAFMSSKFNNTNGDWVQQLLPYNKHLFVAGSFATFGSATADGFLELDSLGAVTSYDVSGTGTQNFVLFPQGNTMWIGGNSYSFGSKNTLYAGQLDLNTGLATCWVNALGGTIGILIKALYVSYDTVYIGASGGHLNNSFGMVVGNIVTPVITASGDTLHASGASSYQWFYNGVLIAGYTDSILIGADSGYYVVSGTNALDCQGASAPVYSSGAPQSSSTGIRSVSDISITLFPNPAADVFILKSDGLTGEQYILYDDLGRAIQSEVISSDMQAVHMDNVADGIYTVVVRGAVMRVTVRR